MDGIHMAIKYEIMFLEIIRGSVHGRKHFPFSIVPPSGNIVLVYTICTMFAAINFPKNYQ